MALYKRKKVWWMSFICNGKQVRRSTETTNKKLAEKVYAKVVTQITEGKWLEADEAKVRTFEELADLYESCEFRELKNWQSVQSYFNQLREFFGPYTLNQITPALIDRFKRKRKKKGVKPATINRQLNILKRMLNLAKKRWMWIREVPSIEMMPKADTKRIRHLSFDEYHRLLDCCEDWLKGVVTVAAWTGLRQGNIIRLTRSQVNLSSGVIMLDSDDMKNDENLVIPISEPAFLALQKAMRVAHIKSPYVFCREDGSPYYKTKLQRGFRKAINLAGIENFRFHDLRHCFASWNRQAGVDIETLADLMGHKDTRMTLRYAHITPLHLKAAIGLLEKSYHNSITINKKRS